MDKRDELSKALEDEQFEQLFSSLDDVKASDELKAQTLAMIFASAPPEGRAVDGGGVEAAADGGKSREGQPAESAEDDASAKSASAAEHAEPAKPIPTAHKPSRKGRMRAFRVLAAAACVAALSIGGVAYALPSASVVVGYGDSAIELEVNCFGIVVGGSSADDEGKAVLDEVAVRHRNFDDSFADILDAYAERGDSADAMRFEVVTNDADQAANLEQRGENVLARKEPAMQPALLDSQQTAGESGAYGAYGRQDGWQDGQPNQQGQPDQRNDWQAQPGQEAQPEQPGQPAQPDQQAQPGQTDQAGQAGQPAQPGQQDQRGQ